MENRKYSNFNLAFRLIKFMKKLLPIIVLAVFFAVMGFIVTIIIPSIIVKIGFDSIYGEKPKLIYLLYLIILAILRGLFRYGEHYFGHFVAFKVLADFRREIFAKLIRLTPSKLDSKDSGVLLKLIGEDVEALEVFFAHTLAPITTGTLVFIILLIYFININIFSAIIASVVYIILSIIIPNVFANKLRPHLDNQHNVKKEYSSYFLDSLKGMKDILQFGIVKNRFETLEQKSRIVNKEEKKIAKLFFLQFTFSFLVIGFGVLFFAYNNFILVNNESITIKNAVISLVVFSSSFAPFLELSRLPLGLGRALQAGRQTFKLLDETEPISLEDSTVEVENISKIEFKNVYFSYPNREKLIFDNLNIAFKNKKIVGLVGESGSGKSTLMKLVMKWYLTKNGNIYLEDTDIESLNNRELQKKIAYIPQIPQIFSQTIRENLTFGNEKIKDEMILEMAEKCRLKEKILSTKNGLDTVINSEKIIFSSGELQRLELIRAFLKNAEIYIFDEPTSNLDTLNEATILKLIKENVNDMVFLISHRESTVSCADIIYRIENGKINIFKNMS